MNDLIPAPRGEAWIVRQTRHLSGALGSLGPGPVIVWFQECLLAFADFVSAMTQRYRYLRRSRRDLRDIIKALRKGDGRAQACAQFCERMEALLPTIEDKAIFAELFVSAFFMETQSTITFFAEQERRYVISGLQRYRLSG